MGGQYREHEWQSKRSYGWDATHRAGIYSLRARSLADVLGRAWFPYNKTSTIQRRPIVSGGHHGCIERRAGFGGACEYAAACARARRVCARVQQRVALCFAHAARVRACAAAHGPLLRWDPIFG